MTIYFTSDTHFGHANIIKYCKRPFDSSQHMDEVLCDNWNSIVKPTDIVYHLGDFAFSKTPEKYFHRLNGVKHLIVGNHDYNQVLALPWESINQTLMLSSSNVFLCHYAMRVWNNSHKNTIQLYGHSHNKLSGNNKQLDVGVDAWNFKPTRLKEIQRKLNTLKEYTNEK